MKPPDSKLAAARALLASLNSGGKGTRQVATKARADVKPIEPYDLKELEGSGATDQAPLSELAQLAELRNSKTYSGLSLKARALKMLALRDLSTAELRRKLRLVVATTPEMGKTNDDVDELLVDFTARGWQSDTRFAEQLARRRSKFGNARLAQELKSHGLDKTTVTDTLDAASSSEYARALTAWQKKFDAPATSAKERAKQGRFLAARGFSADVMRRVMNYDPSNEQGGPSDSSDNASLDE